ncbi:MAG TPA: type II toxin-antitoxin system Phd/YefM family antitoxin [Bacteroidales bacterium]|nr:type II toxin-antitoxin system Phd/YefM family antitoxin [Bacteroidales bacterium]
MKTATAKKLRTRAAAILETVSKGNEVVITKRGKSIAILKPFLEKSKKEFSPVGFGLWKNRKDLKDVAGWVGKQREERF